GHRCGFKLLLEDITDEAVFIEQFAEVFLLGIPLRAPIVGDCDAQTDWISFLSHNFYSSDTTIRMWQLRLRIGPAEPRAFGVKRRNVVAVPATASRTRRFSGFAPLLFSALAMADIKVFATSLADLRGT